MKIDPPPPDVPWREAMAHRCRSARRVLGRHPWATPLMESRVSPGEQQPETEHNFKGERTSTGVWRDRRFRHADGWFSYDLKTRGRADLRLRVTYFGSDRRRFTILADDQELARVDLNAPTPGEFIDRTYDIPPSTLKKAEDGVLTLKFVAEPGSMAGGIFDVRLLSGPATN